MGEPKRENRRDLPSLSTTTGARLSLSAACAGGPAAGGEAFAGAAAGVDAGLGAGGGAGVDAAAALGAGSVAALGDASFVAEPPGHGGV